MLIEFVQQNILWVAVAIISGTMLVWPLFAGAGASLSPAEATLLINREDALVLDVRESSEFGRGHIAGARHITQAQLAERLSEIDKFKTKPVIVCCAAGTRAASACKALRKVGFERAYALAGGIGAWSGAGLPLTSKG